MIDDTRRDSLCDGLSDQRRPGRCGVHPRSMLSAQEQSEGRLTVGVAACEGLPDNVSGWWSYIIREWDFLIPL